MKWLAATLIFLLFGSGSCHQAAAPADRISGLDTTLFGGPQRTGVLTDPTLAEVSGLAPSLSNPGYLWTEEDSGNPNQIQLISPTARVAARFILPTLTNHDWEDIATGPGPTPGRAYVYLAEIGDNAAGPIDRTLYRLLDWPARKVIYRFPEPVLAGQKLPLTATIRSVDTISLILPDGPHDAEAILVDPATSDLYLLSKGWTCTVYQARFPQSLTKPVVMQPVLTLPLAKVTAAALSPDGREILVRTYKQLFYYERQAGESVLTALRRSPRQVPLAAEPQGEAIGWRLDGTGYYSTSEVWHKEPQAIYFYPRTGHAPVLPVARQTPP